MSERDFLTLGIETSCDDTAVAVLRGEREIAAELLSSQIGDHARFGGVVPEFAARKHLENILPLVDAALREAGIEGKNLNLIAVTRGPGLMGSLMVGVQTARALSRAWNVPLIGVNHLEGHMFAPLIDAEGLTPPFLSLIASGGHTEIIRVEAFGKYALLGETRDDAAGEAYDKAAKIMGLPYPGGPEIDRLAQTGNPDAFDFPIPLKHSGKIEFSFSGLKTALLWKVNKLKEEGKDLPLSDLSASFQKSVTDALVSKVALAVHRSGIKNVTASGGVAANSALRKALKESRSWKAWLPAKSRCTDNAVMIAMAGYNARQRGLCSPPDLSPDPSLPLT
ncbi:MAG: tRNA (adenosine(37)-N6)-threonylcarbamoyltransferase complex transferase subunit TsaD [Synergistaceae bacterium]|jgi:N6-L-threonylcarbamoyladenine synthase|nr:tRNA (adenosine(37)-N6)-threonylcarbamoyltransferase complex transferase subunit TsaD [Synergistaceae bacterium]